MTERDAAKMATALALKMSGWANELVGWEGRDPDRPMTPGAVKRFREDMAMFLDDAPEPKNE